MNQIHSASRPFQLWWTVVASELGSHGGRETFPDLLDPPARSGAAEARRRLLTTLLPRCITGEEL